MLRFTEFTRTDGRPLSKKVSIKDGKLHKEPSGAMWKGEFRTVECEWADFGNYLLSLDPSRTFALGVCSRTNTSGSIVTSGAIVRRASGDSDPDASVLTRTKDHFTWHGDGLNEAKQPYLTCGVEGNLICFDLDELEDNPPIDDVVHELLTALPELAKLASGLWAYPSAGSFIYRTDGAMLKGLTGLHLYALLPTKYHPEAFRMYIEYRLWMEKMMWAEVTTRGSVILRGTVDLSVFSPERLVFANGSLCESPLHQDRGLPKHYPAANFGDLILDYPKRDLEAMRQLAKGEVRLEAEKVRKALAKQMAESEGITLEAAQKRLNNYDRGVLASSHVVKTDQHGALPAWRFMLNKTKYDNAGCADPIEPEYGGGQGKGKVYVNLKNDVLEVVIWSFAHGGCTWRVHHDLRGVTDMLNFVEEEASRTGESFEQQMTTFLGSSWIAQMFSKEASDLSADERKQIVDRLSKLTGRKVKAINDEIKQTLTRNATTDIDRMVNVFNEKYAVLQLSNKVRILSTDETDDESLLSYQDFKILTAPERIFIDDKSHPAAEIWLQSEHRRIYSGMVFDPKTPDRTVSGKYNLFRGFTVSELPPVERPCRGVRCAGRGCADLLDRELQAHGRVRPVMKATNDLDETFDCEGGCMRILKHIVMVCGNADLSHGRWILDWCADMFQRPGYERFGTAVVMRGPMGSGKGTLAEILGTILGRHYMSTPHMEKLTGRFNFHMKDKLLILADEAVWGGDRAAAGALKHLVTSPVLTMEPKGVDSIVMPNHVRVMMATNEDWACPVGYEERRFAIFDMWRKYMQDPGWFEPLYWELGMDRNKRSKETGLASLLWELRNLKITSDVSKIPHTQAMFEQKAYNMSSVEEFWLDKLVEGSSALFVTGLEVPELHREFLERYSTAHDIRYWASSQRFSLKLISLTGGLMRNKVTKPPGSRVSVRMWAPIDLAKARSAMDRLLGETDWGYESTKECDEGGDCYGGEQVQERQVQEGVSQ